MLSIEEFTNKYIGKSIVFKNGFGQQCYNLPIRYWHEVCGVDKNNYPICPNGDVLDFYNSFKKIKYFSNNFVLIDKTNKIPKKGDVVLYNFDNTGYVEIVLFADDKGMTVLAQNPYNKNINEQETINDTIQIINNRTYTNVLGFIRFNGNTIVPSKNQETKFKSNLLSSILNIKEHMNDLRSTSFTNAIGNENEDYNFIANEFRLAWDKSNETENLETNLKILNKEIQVLKTTRNISPNAIGYKKPIDTTYSDSIIKSLDDNYDLYNPNKDTDKYIPEQNLYFDLNIFLIGTVKDGSAYLFINIILTSLLYVFLTNTTQYNKDKTIILTYTFFVAGLLLSFTKAYTNILKFKKL